MQNSIKYITFVAVFTLVGIITYFRNNVRDFFILYNIGENYCIKDCNETKKDKYNLLSNIREGTYIDVNVSKKLLIVVDDYKIKKITKTALGKKGYGKKIQGDLKTPMGEYEICDTRKSKGYHRFLQLSYPSPEDAKRGLENKIINQKEYLSIIESHKKGICPPPTKLGGFVGIHAESEKIPFFIPYNWTHGCIGVNSKEIRQIENIVKRERKKGNRVKVNIYQK